MFVVPVLNLAMITVSGHRSEGLRPHVLHAERRCPLLRENITVANLLCSILSQLAQILLIESRKMVFHCNLLCASSFIQLWHFQVLGVRRHQVEPAP